MAALREHCHALPVGARHAGDVSAPKAALRPERIEDLANVFVDIAVGVGLARIARRARELDRDIRVFGQCQHLAEIGESGVVLPDSAPAAAAMMIDVQFQIRVTPGYRAEFGHVPAGQQSDRKPFPFTGRPEPVERTVAPPALLVRLIEGKSETKHARALPPVPDDVFAIWALQIEMPQDSEFAGARAPPRPQLVDLLA
jgi:hypothetical protein